MKQIICALLVAAQWCFAQASLATIFVTADSTLRAIILESTLRTQGTDEAQNPEKKFATSDKIIGITSGILFGVTLGAMVGSIVGDGEYADYARGGLIGASILPFINYEFVGRRQQAIRGVGGIGLKLGGDLTFTNYDSRSRSAVVAGLSRDYKAGRHTALRADFGYSARRFTLPAQVLRYASLGSPRRLEADVNFKVDYWNTSFLFVYRREPPAKFGYHFFAGPALSVVVANKTYYTIYSNEEIRTSFSYDFIYVGDEPGEILFYAGIDMGCSVQRGHWFVEAKLRRPFVKTHQIFPLEDGTALYSLDGVLGFRF